MPMDRRLYPANWDEIARGIKDAAGWKCQCCDKPCCPPNKDFWQWAVCLSDSQWADELPDEDESVFMEKWEERSIKARFTLTVAHLNHQPEDCRPENLRALCSVCHLRYDASQMALKRMLKAERNGQLNLFGGGVNG